MSIFIYDAYQMCRKQKAEESENNNNNSKGEGHARAGRLLPDLLAGACRVAIIMNII